MKNRLNLLFYFCSVITLLILALPVKYRLAYFAPTLLGYIYLFTLLATILLIIYLMNFSLFGGFVWWGKRPLTLVGAAGGAIKFEATRWGLLHCKTWLHFLRDFCCETTVQVSGWLVGDQQKRRLGWGHPSPSSTKHQADPNLQW